LHVSNEKRWAETVTVWGFALLFYVATGADNLTESHDAIYFLQEIESGQLFHAHHLLYNALGALWIALVETIGFSRDSADQVRFLDTMFGAGVLTVFFRIVRDRFGGTRRLAAALTGCLGVSFGLWFYATTVEVYVVPLFFVLLCIHLMLARSASTKVWAWLGLFHALAIVFHQCHVLLVVPIAVCLLLTGREGLVRRAAAYAAVAVPLVAVPYLTVMVSLGHDTIPEMTRWVIGYGASDLWWRPAGLGTAQQAALGFSRAFLGGHFAFAFESVREAVGLGLPDSWLNDEAFLVRSLTPASALLCVVAAVGAGAAALGALLMCVRAGFPKIRGTSLPILAAALASYALFFFFWDPSNVEFWLPQAAFAWLILASVLAAAPSHERRSVQLAVVTMCLLGTANYLGSMKWLANPANDYYAVKAAALTRQAKPGDLIIVAQEWILLPAIQRQTDARVVSLQQLWTSEAPAAAADHLRAEVSTLMREGSTVYVDEDAWDPPERLVTYCGDGFEAYVAGVMPGMGRDLGYSFANGRVYRLVTAHTTADPPMP
jgi:hypothetical protein